VVTEAEIARIAEAFTGALDQVARSASRP
jgi:hypothetical protein